MIKDTSKTLPKIKAIGYFSKMFGYKCPFCNQKLKTYFHYSYNEEDQHYYKEGAISLYKLNRYKCEVYEKNIFRIFDYKESSEHIFEGYIDSSDKNNIVKNMRDIFNKYYENLIFL